MKTNQHNSGFTLVELMIGLVLTSIFVAGLIQILSNTQNNVRIVNNLSIMTEDGRYALDFLAKEIRRSGYLKRFYELPANLAFQAATNPFIATNDGETIKGANDATFIDQFVIRYQINDLNELDPNFALSSCSRELGRGNLEDTSNVQNHIITLYFYVATDANGIPVLYCQGQRNNLDDPTKNISSPPKPMISYVEAMRVLYSEEIEVAGVAKMVYRDQSQVTDWKNISSMKISLVLQSEDKNVAMQPISNYFLNGNHQYSTRNSSEKRLYRFFSTTISLRN